MLGPDFYPHSRLGWVLCARGGERQADGDKGGLGDSGGEAAGSGQAGEQEMGPASATRDEGDSLGAEGTMWPTWALVNGHCPGLRHWWPWPGAGGAEPGVRGTGLVVGCDDVLASTLHALWLQVSFFPLLGPSFVYVSIHSFSFETQNILCWFTPEVLAQKGPTPPPALHPSPLLFPLVSGLLLPLDSNPAPEQTALYVGRMGAELGLRAQGILLLFTLNGVWVFQPRF